jgi:hypothetical protein
MYLQAIGPLREPLLLLCDLPASGLDNRVYCRLELPWNLSLT